MSVTFSKVVDVYVALDAPPTTPHPSSSVTRAPVVTDEIVITVSCVAK